MDFRARRHIEAEPDAVWSRLLDVDAWPHWESRVTRVEGIARDGGRVKVFSDVSPGRAFPVRVALDNDRRVMICTPMGKRMPDLQSSFDQFAHGLKARCERG